MVPGLRAGPTVSVRKYLLSALGGSSQVLTLLSAKEPQIACHVIISLWGLRIHSLCYTEASSKSNRNQGKLRRVFTLVYHGEDVMRQESYSDSPEWMVTD